MPTTRDGKQFPYTADGILAAKRHEEFLRKANDQRTMDNSTNGEKTDKDKLPPYVKPRHLDPNHPMNREGPPQKEDTSPKYPPQEKEDTSPKYPPQQYASSTKDDGSGYQSLDEALYPPPKKPSGKKGIPIKKKPNPSMYG